MDPAVEQIDGMGAGLSNADVRKLHVEAQVNVIGRSFELFCFILGVVVVIVCVLLRNWIHTGEYISVRRLAWALTLATAIAALWAGWLYQRQSRKTAQARLRLKAHLADRDAARVPVP